MTARVATRIHGRPQWGQFTGPARVQGMPIMWPSKGAGHVSQDAPLTSEEVAGLAERISRVLKGGLSSRYS